MKKFDARTLVMWVIVFGMILFFLQTSRTPSRMKIPYSEFKTLLKDGQISELQMTDRLIEGSFRTPTGTEQKFQTIPLMDPKLVDQLEEYGVKNYAGAQDRGWVTSLLANALWIGLFFFLWWMFVIRQMQSGGRQAMAFGKSKAKNQTTKKGKVLFKDVAGVDEAKDELKEIIDFLKDPAKFQRLGGKVPKGVLLYGSPGTGKTMLAKAVAGEANVPFFSASGSEFVEMFVGVGASRVRDLFDQGKKNAPCLLFIDELDAVGRHRFAGIGGGHDEREQTLNQILVELDGFESRDGVILIAATNRPDVLDPALLRPGRFDRHIMVPAPDLKGREQILKVHAANVKMAADVDMTVIARRTPGFVGADLANVVNEAALLAARFDKSAVEMNHLESAIDRVMAGPERKSRLLSEHEKKVVSFHESGHTLVAKLTPGSDPVHKVSIVSRGMALGYTMQLPTEDKYLTSRTELYNRILVLMGGRVAEQIIFSEITTGAQDDLMKATNLASKMVCEYGMSDSVGPVTYKKPEAEVFMGRDMGHERGFSEQTAQQIDGEVKRILTTAFEKVKDLLEKNRDKLETLAAALTEKENLNGDEINSLLGLPAAS
ncbi:MAG: ATP-dependent zinc metalloprotease FtsH [Elusimicrobia bacterium]|nr:ATP-dependent zinc metalloprotease FtsH [Elusimicrobiota bacterium]